MINPKIVSKILFGVVAILMFAGVLIPTKQVHAGSNGQQIIVNLCYSEKLTITGSNQDGKNVTFTIKSDPYGCGTYKTTNWWWKNGVTIKADFPSGSRQIVKNIPVAQKEDWYTVNFPQIPGDKILGRAKKWVDQNVPYSQNSYKDGYRTDCSGFVSYAWSLNTSAVTGTLKNYTNTVTFDGLQPGDAINNQGSGNNGHVVLFVRWVNKSTGVFIAYEENGGKGKAVQTQLTLIRNSNSNTSGYIQQYSSIPKTWVPQRSK